MHARSTANRGISNTKRYAKPVAKMKHTLDLRGMILPFTVLKLSNVFRKMGTGEVLEIIGTSPDAKKYILEVLATLHCEVLGVHKRKDCYLIRLKKLGAVRTQKRAKKKDQRHVQAGTS